MNKTDRELLELSAKACGFLTQWVDEKQLWVREKNQEFEAWWPWNPLSDDGDCSRMESALSIDVSWGSSYAMADHHSLNDCVIETLNAHDGNKQAARRMASLRAAAAIGESMK